MKISTASFLEDRKKFLSVLIESLFFSSRGEAFENIFNDLLVMGESKFSLLHHNVPVEENFNLPDLALFEKKKFHTVFS